MVAQFYSNWHFPHPGTTCKLQQHWNHSDSGLAAEAIEGAALALERMDDVHGGDGLATGVLHVGDGVMDDAL